MHPFVRRVAPLAGAAALALVLSACSGSTGGTSGTDHGSAGMTGMPSTSTTAAPGGASDQSRAGDVMFAQMMIPHHEQAVDMADIALSKQGVSAQVRQLATQIKAAQDPEIQTMRQWLQSWGATATSTGMDHDGMASGEGMMSQADMDSLAKAEGAAFDAKWVAMMIDHHEGAITTAKQVLSTTKDDQVKALANAIVTAQTQEIATMKGLS